MLRTLALAIFLSAATPALAALDVVATIPDLQWLVKEIGGDAVQTKSLLRGSENPHHVDAVPSFISAVAGAKAVVFVGLELEVGWLPKVLSKSGNAGVQPGGKGYCDASSTVTVLEKPAGKVDRSHGDVHPLGNSHYWLGPQAMAEAADGVATCLAGVDPNNGEKFRAGAVKVKKKLMELRTELSAALAPVRASKFLEYHKEFVYFFAAYGLSTLGSLEEKPGVPPSAGRIATVALDAKAQKARVLLAGQWAPRAQLARFQELSGVPTLTLPTSTEPGTDHADYVAWQRQLTQKILATSATATP